MKNFSIPQPCSEDFNLMTPTERGAFCNKCATDTFDFRGKSATQIKHIFKENLGGRVCGRITSAQLEELNLEFEQWSFQSVKSFQSMFLYCLIAVFGLSLFSCSNPQDIAQIRSTKCWGLPKTDSIIEEQKPVQPIAKNIVPDSCWEETQGMFDFTNNYKSMLTETPEEAVVEPIQEAPITLEGMLFPNPTINSTTLDLQVPESDYFVLDLFDMAGQHIRNIHDGSLDAGTFRTEISLFGLPPGMYLVVVRLSALSKTLRVEKI